MRVTSAVMQALTVRPGDADSLELLQRTARYLSSKGIDIRRAHLEAAPGKKRRGQ